MDSKELPSAQIINTNDSVCCELLKRRIKLDNETVRIDLEIKKAEYEYRTKLQEMAISALENSDYKKLDYIKQLYDLGDKEFFIEPLTKIKTTITTNDKSSTQTVDENKSTEKNIKLRKPIRRLQKVKRQKNGWFTKHLISSKVHHHKICHTLYFGSCTDNSCEFKHKEHIHSIVKANSRTGLNMHLSNNNVVYFKSRKVKTNEDLKQLISNFKMIKY